jgi:hemolysin III
MTFLKRTVSAQLHLLGCILAAIGLGLLLHKQSLHITPYHFWACLVYGLTSIFVFATSSIYHFLNDGIGLSPTWTLRLENLDHFAIYFFIAGSYTAILINAVAAPWRGVLLIAVWTIAFLGVLYTYFKPQLPAWAQHRYLYTGLFIAMGWLIIVRIDEILTNLHHSQLLVPFIMGGLSYSIGAIFYATKWPNIFEKVLGFHEVWHIMVLIGYCFHYYVIYSFYSA